MKLQLEKGSNWSVFALQTGKIYPESVSYSDSRKSKSPEQVGKESLPRFIFNFVRMNLLKSIQNIFSDEMNKNSPKQWISKYTKRYCISWI